MSRELVQMAEENSKTMQLTSCVTRCDNVAPIILFYMIYLYTILE